MLRRSSLVECVSVLHGTCLQSVGKKIIRQYVQPCLSKNPKYTFCSIKSSLTLAYYETGTAMNARTSENYLAISCSSSASKSVEIYWAEIYWGRLIFRPNLVSFNRAIVPLLELSFLTKSQKLSSTQKHKFLSVCQQRFDKLKNINISKTS